MRCAKLVVPETGFVGEEKFCLSSDGGGFEIGSQPTKIIARGPLQRKLVERSREVVSMWPLGRGTVI